MNQLGLKEGLSGRFIFLSGLKLPKIILTQIHILPLKKIMKILHNNRYKLVG